MEIAILGHMGRDEAAADRLLNHKLHILGQFRNPGLVEKAEATGGSFHLVESITDTNGISDIVAGLEPDMFFTNFDDSLAADVVGAVRQKAEQKGVRDLLIPSPDSDAARVEWDKFYLRGMIDEVAPEFNPVNFMADTADAALEAIDFFEATGKELVIKPRNLSGGKGVKVQGKHFETYAEAREYALKVLQDESQTGLEVQEKLEGHEFTLQLFTDGSVLIEPPATYDYPYREDGDVGPGTGGMGSFTCPAGEQLPFITEGDYRQAMRLMHDLLGVLRERGHDYKGVLYPTFFKTAEGLKIVEINARGGDPELINILDLMDDSVDFADVLADIARGELSADSVRYKKLASTMIYLVSPEYGYGSDASYNFTLRPEVIVAHGCRLRFAAAEKNSDGTYRTVGSSRTVGLSAVGSAPWEARAKIMKAIKEGVEGPLEFRHDIGDADYIRSLK